jgi:hypothetical protein
MDSDGDIEVLEIVIAEVIPRANVESTIGRTTRSGRVSE